MKKKLVKSKTQRGWELKKEHLEKKSVLPSVTVPSEALTMRDLVDRFTRGVTSVGKISKAMWLDVDHDDPDYNRMFDLDMAELQELQEEVEFNRQDAEKRLADIKKAQLDKEEREGSSREGKDTREPTDSSSPARKKKNNEPVRRDDDGED